MTNISMEGHWQETLRFSLQSGQEIRWHQTKQNATRSNDLIFALGGRVWS